MTSPSLISAGHRHVVHATGLAMHPRELPTRLWPQEAHDALLEGTATLVDIRPLSDRLGEGEVLRTFGAVHVDADTLERLFVTHGRGWLLEATYAARLIVLSQDGSDSNRAAETLRRIGVAEAADVIGGYDAWRRGGLPISPWPELL